MDFNLNIERSLEQMKKGAFLTVKSGEKLNTMTIGWGYIGVMWGEKYFIAMVRPTRYTNDLLINSSDFTVTLPLNDALNQELILCGTKSGRDIDKGSIVSFIDSKSVNSPIIKGKNFHYECKIRTVQTLDGSKIGQDIQDKYYPEKDFHYLYFGEIVEAYETV